MVLNKKGGKKAKKMSRARMNQGINLKINSIGKTEGQDYGIVANVLGNRQLSVILDRPDENYPQVMAMIRPRRGRYFKQGSIILVSEREFEKGKYDVLMHYQNEQYRALVKAGEITNDLINKVIIEEDQKNNNLQQENTIQQNAGYVFAYDSQDEDYQKDQDLETHNGFTNNQSDNEENAEIQDDYNQYVDQLLKSQNIKEVKQIKKPKKPVEIKKRTKWTASKNTKTNDDGFNIDDI